MFTTHPSVVGLGLRSDLPVDSPNGQSCGCDGDRTAVAHRSIRPPLALPVGRCCNGGADRWRGFPRPWTVRKELRHLWLRLRHPEYRADPLDAVLMLTRRRLAQLTPPSYIVASTGWVPPVTVSSPSRRGWLQEAQTVSGWESAPQVCWKMTGSALGLTY